MTKTPALFIGHGSPMNTLEKEWLYRGVEQFWTAASSA